MNRRAVVFQAPGRIEIREDEIPSPGDGEILVRASVSGISAGTERHFYRGDLAPGTVLDEALGSLEGDFRYPMTYGYACVGETGDEGRRVFAFHPHVSHFLAREEDVYELPRELSTEAAAMWPSVETAVNLVLDARPLVGERVVVVGQGVVGLVTTSLLSQFPLAELSTVDPIEARRSASTLCGASRSLHPEEIGDLEDVDLAIEVSGTAAGLNLAVGATGFEGRVVIGSWYGDEPVAAELGTHFHRGRLRLISSQVSHLGAPLSSRWTKRRRMEAAARALTRVPVEALVTHRFPLDRAADAYQLIDERPAACLQVLLTYT